MLRTHRTGLVVASCLLLVGLGVAASARGDDTAHLAVVGFGKIAVHSYASSQMLMHGTLLDGSGVPASGVGVTVTAQPLDGEPATAYDGITDSRGRYAVRVPRGSSRLITVSADGSTREVKEIVSPVVWLTASSRGHGRMRFSGGVAASRSAPLPTVILQDQTPSGWRTFAAVNPNGSSHLWRRSYRASRGLWGYRFAFRATTLPNSAWAPGYSETKDAVIR